MRSMTDFIDSINVDNIPSVYNEDYSLAEEYSEYFNESSDVYAGNIFNSSGYQFFGEAAFYQEAHKGLIAGGILALVSGAFFMIMKLLKNGGSGGGGSTSSSKSSSGSSTKSSSKYEPTKAEESKKGLNATFDSSEVQGADVSAARNLLNGDNKSTETKEKSETKQLPELESEEKLVWDVNTILKELENFKKHNKNAGLPYDIIKLKWIREALSTVDHIVFDMYAITQDDLWYILSSSDLKNDKVRKFFENKQTLSEKMNELQKLSKNVKNTLDNHVDDIADYLREINQHIRSIEDRCKEGMKLCREKREQEKYKNDISNIDKMYTLLNDVLKNINVVCKDLQAQFKTLKSLFGNFYVTLQCFMPKGLFGFGIDEIDEFDLDRFKKANNFGRKLFRIVHLCMLSDNQIDNIITSTRISESEIKDSDPNARLDRLNKNRQRLDFNITMLTKNFPDYKDFFDNLKAISERQLDLVEDLFRIDVKTVLDKQYSDIPEAKKLKESNYAEEAYGLIDKYFPDEK